jgi:hypothetical protein
MAPPHGCSRHAPQEAGAARIEAAGELDGVELHIVHWQTDAAIAAANELMRKRKAADRFEKNSPPSSTRITPHFTPAKF